jgi:ABC-type dipeptide/oligopeptide/nickel transport system permease component
MKHYFFKRIFLVIPTMIGITLITFILLKALPGDPVQGLAGERTSPETIKRLKKELGTEQPVLFQYAGYIKLLLRGELGRSYYTNRKITDDIKEKLPNTIKLAVGAMIFSTLFGLLLGILMAIAPGSIWDRIGQLISVSGISVPVFFLGLLLIYLFSFVFQILPPSGMGNGSILFLIMPAATLGLNSSAYLARITRSSLIEILSQPYIVTAKAKGVKKSSIIVKHALKNAFIPIVTLIGLDFGSYLNGSVLTETIFGWDGIGRYAVEGIFKRDYPVILGCVLVGAVLFVLVNLSVDLLYGFFDPRIRRRVKTQA